MKKKTKTKEVKVKKVSKKVKSSKEKGNSFSARFNIKDEVLFCAEANVFIPAIVHGVKFADGMVYYTLHVFASNGDYWLNEVRSTRIANLKMEF